MEKFRFFRALTILVCLSFLSANAQIQGCSLQGIEIQECLNQAANTAPCCQALNHAAQAGYYCLCLVLRSSTPLLGIALSLQLSSCDVTVPPLSQCQSVLPVFPPDPFFRAPATDHPPAIARPLPVEMGTRVPKPKQPVQVQSSSPDDFMVPFPPKWNEISPNSTPTSNASWLASGRRRPLTDTDLHPEIGIPRMGNVKSHGGHRFKVLLHPRLFLSVALSAIM